MRLSTVALSSRQRRFALLALAVAAVHALLLLVMLPAWVDTDDAPSTPPVLHVRTVLFAAPMPEPPGAQPPAPQAVAPVSPLRRGAPLAASVGSTQSTSAPAPVAAITPSPPVDNEAPVAEGGMPSSVPVDLPVYATRLPAAGAWRYALQRGLASGEAVLTWQPTEQGRYTLRLEGRVAGLPLLDWVSQGAIDGAGIAPERFAIRRRGRDTQAANFQRDAGKITFSGPTHELPLLPGVQDRVSWMLQLGSALEATPALRAPGSRVTLMVVGARGGAGLWRFSVVGVEPLGDTAALKLVHESERVHDTRVEVWLDPARGHLPLRAVLTPPEGGAPLELNLQREGSTGP
jgi:hypothetical protein